VEKSMSTKAKAAGDGDDGGRKKAKLGVLSGCDIKTEELFNENFGPYGYRIEDESNLVMSEWNNPAGHAKIKPWLVSCGPYFASLIDKIKRNSETSLYPLLVNALVPIMELSTCKIEASEHTIEGMAIDEKEEIAELISNQSHAGSIVEPVSAEVEALGTIDTTNAAQVLKFILFMEETIKSCEFKNKGRVELIIHNTTKPKNADKVAVLEAKPTISADSTEGFYQTCAYMAIAEVKYGIYTSHTAWQFLRLDTEEVASASSTTT
jgi:hypothetical protein